MHPVCTRTAPLVGRTTRALLLLFPVLLAAARQTLPPPGESAARADTRESMLGRDVLDAEKHPLVRIESIALVGPQWGPTVTARVTLRGVTRDLRFAAAVLRQDDMLVVVAAFRINQSEFGIEPFTALNGGLRVRDALDIRVRLVARREK